MTEKKELTLDEAFSDQPQESPQGEQPETESKEPQQQQIEEAPPQSEPVPQEEQQKSWKDYGLTEFDGLTEEQIAKKIVEERKQVQYRNKLYGDQANELGSLRKEIEELKGKFTKPPQETEAVHPELLDNISDMTEAEILDYNELYEKNPVKAIMKYGKKQIQEMIKAEISSTVEPKVKTEVSERITDLAYATEYLKLQIDHPDFNEYSAMIDFLNKEEYLGPQRRPLEERYQIAKLSKPDENGEPTEKYKSMYQLLYKYPQMSFQEAEEIYNLRSKSQAVNPKDVRQEITNKVRSIDNLSTTTKKQGVANVRPAKTVDEAFDMS